MLQQKKFLEKGDRAIIVSDVNLRKDTEILEIREI